MEKFMKVFMMVVCLLFLVGTANATYLNDSGVLYNMIDYPEFHLGLRGGADGHSGAYVTIYAGVTEYYEMSKISIKAKHITSDFEVSLIEDHPECVGVVDYPFGPIDQYFWVNLQPADWMKNQWEITLTYMDINNVKQTEIRPVYISGFFYPPLPTGLQFAEELGKTWLIWNRIADPSDAPGRRYQPVVKHYTSSPYCVDEFHRISSGGTIPYQLWRGNRIAIEIPSHWQHGDLIKIENRLYDGGRFDRASKYIILP
jgi:hypothetical protein